MARRRDDEDYAYREDESGEIDQQAVDDYFRSQTGGSQAEAARFLNDNPGDVERLYAPQSGGASVFADVHDREEPSQGPQPSQPPPGQPPPPTSGTQPITPRPPLQPVPFPAVGGGGGQYNDTQQRLIDTLTRRFEQGYQPQPAVTQQGNEVVRLLQAQEARAAQEAAQRRAFEEQLRTVLMDLIRKGQEPISTEQTPEAKAFGRVKERALQRYRAQQAEQRAAQGIGQTQQGEVSGALASDIQGGEAQLAEQIAAFESRLVADQINRRREQLMQALQLGAGMMSSEQQNAIRRELAQLDASLRRELAKEDLGLRSFLGGGQLSLGLLSALQSNDQFYDRLGADVGIQNELLRLRYLGL